MGSEEVKKCSRELIMVLIVLVLDLNGVFFVMLKIIAISVILWIGDVLEAGKLVLEKIQMVKTSA